MFYHVKCSIKTKYYACLIENNIGWICTHCREEIFPFTNETNDELFDIFNENTNIPSLPKRPHVGPVTGKLKRASLTPTSIHATDFFIYHVLKDLKKI